MATFLQSGGTVIRTRAASLRGIVVLVGVAGVPLFFLRVTNDPFNVPKLALLMAVVAVGSWLLAIEMLQGYRPPGLRLIALPAIVFLTPLVLATVLSPYRGWALWGEYQRFQGLIPYALAVGLGVLVATSFAGRAAEIAFWFSVAGGVAGAYATFQYFGVDLFAWANQFGGEAVVTSTLGNPNFIGGFLAIALPISVSLWMEDRTDYVAMLLSALILAGVVFSFSQGGWAGALGGASVYLGFELREKIRGARWMGMIVAVLVAAVAAGVVIAGIVSSKAPSVSTTLQVRSWWWETAWDTGMERPLFGHGPNSFALDWWEHRTPEEASVEGFDSTNDPHSVYLSLFDGSGVLGVAGLVFVIGWAIAQGWNRSDRGSAAFLAGVVAYAIQAIASVDEVSLRVGLWTCLAGLVAAGLAPSDSQKSDQPRGARKTKHRQRETPVRSVSSIIVGGLVALAVVSYSFVFIVADAAVRHGRNAFAAGDSQTVEDSYGTAQSFRDDYTHRRSFGFYLGSLAAAVDDDLREDLLNESLDAFSYLEVFPDVAGFRDRGRVLVENAEWRPSLSEAAAASYLQAMEIDRFNVILIPEGSGVLLEAGHYDDLVRLLPPVMDVLGPRAPALWPILGLAYEETGDLERARAALEQALALAPDDTNTAELQTRLD